MTCAAKYPTVPSTNEAAADTPLFHQIPSGTHAEDTTMTFTASVTEAETATPPPRLLDSDPNKFRSLKQVIVIGRPGSGTDGIADALKRLGFKVYDFQAASNRYIRDFPLWLEAARLRSEGRPYNQSDYDKLIGDYNALVGAPTCFFDHEKPRPVFGSSSILLTTARYPSSSRTHAASIMPASITNLFVRLSEKRTFWRCPT
ncbi:hypothetical protein EJ07DRAFT_152055 [Lizonia empirigonia]|nr:hypothetical protein EJ07DRAFT_152055 [Lizonia empirigonia]